MTGGEFLRPSFLRFSRAPWDSRGYNLMPVYLEDCIAFNVLKHGIIGRVALVKRLYRVVLGLLNQHLNHVFLIPFHLLS